MSLTIQERLSACGEPLPGGKNTLAIIIREFSNSSDFLSKADKTRRDYIRYLKEIDDIFGDLNFDYIQSPRARGKFKQWRDTMSDRPRTADYAWSTLARLLSFGKDRGHMCGDTGSSHGIISSQIDR